MELTLNYNQIFRIINCNNIIFFEDDFSFSDKKESLLYGYSRMNREHREKLLKSINENCPELAEHLKSYNALFDEYLQVINWNEDVIRDDITTAFTNISALGFSESAEKLKDIYLQIEIPTNQDVLKLFYQHGLGVTVPDYYKDLFDESIFREHMWKGFKVYKDFSASTRDLLKQDLDNNSLTNGTAACIIDNQLSIGEERASEILDFIKNFNNEKRSDIIGAVLSSKRREEHFTTEFFAEYVDKKDKINLQKNLQYALVKSMYSLILNKLKGIYLSTLEGAFNEAIANKDIAAYLSKMASYEGITNYKVVTDWIHLLFNFKMDNNTEILDIVKLTKLIDLLNDEDSEFSEEMLKLNTFEAFDYNVNTFFQPPAAGDIFIDDDKNEYYILVGQDCDIITSQSRNGYNAVTEFVKAEIVSKDSLEKLSTNLEYMSVDNFKEIGSNVTTRLQIKYSSRVFIDNTIIKLCCYNDLGKCELNLKEPLSYDISDFLAPYLLDTHKELQSYFTSINNLKGNSSEDLLRILNSDHSPRQIPLTKYEIEGEQINFNLRRVCRMNRTYVLYLFKLFLEYRGRHPFDCINLTRHSSLEAAVMGFEFIKLPYVVILSTNRNTNRNAIKKLAWQVKSKDLETVIKQAFGRDVKMKIDFICLDKNPYRIDCVDGTKIELVKKSGDLISIELRNQLHNELL